MAAFAVTYPLAKVVSGCFEGHWHSVVFYFTMLVVYPVLGFVSPILCWRFVIFCRRGNQSNGDHKHDA